MYRLNTVAMRAFLKAPSMDNLALYCSSFFRYNGVSGDHLPNQIVYYGFIEESRISGQAPEPVGGYGRLRVYTELIDFMSDTYNFQSVLSDYGIEDDVISYVIIEHFHHDGRWFLWNATRRMCFWIHTDNGEYFMIETALYENNPQSTYTIYGLDEYRKMEGM